MQKSFVYAEEQALLKLLTNAQIIFKNIRLDVEVLVCLWISTLGSVDTELLAIAMQKGGGKFR